MGSFWPKYDTSALARDWDDFERYRDESDYSDDDDNDSGYSDDDNDVSEVVNDESRNPAIVGSEKRDANCEGKKEDDDAELERNCRARWEGLNSCTREFCGTSAPMFDFQSYFEIYKYQRKYGGL